jgi:acyl-CoA synthetase
LQLDHFPLTASGKILKRELAEQVKAGKLKPIPVRFKQSPSKQSNSSIVHFIDE